MIEELILRVFAARDITHRAHLASDSYSEHMALGGFYESIIPAIDAIVESHQGLTGEIVEAEESYKPKKITSIPAWLREEAEWIEANRDLISGGSNAVGNLVDNLTGIYLSTIYKLEQLK